ncbi:hypothetical protein N7470_000085 [Penicillium chermesinum]|nr:hypothetical protein N7470_000085 [Penicillium chermesinum]
MTSSHADEQPMNPQYPGWSSTAASTSNQNSPNRREHAVQPPLLTTALGGVHYQHGTTPISSTSLSSPFIHGSPYVSSPANVRSASSTSMSGRQPAAYSVPYNPQDWGPMGNPAQAQYPSGNQLRITPQSRPHTEASLSPPPPPYSPPAVKIEHRKTRGIDGLMGVRHLCDTIILLPPPPQGHQNARSVSHGRADVYQGEQYNAPAPQPRTVISHLSYDKAMPSPALRSDAPGPSSGQLEMPLRPPASRRAASAGAVVSAGPSRPPSQTRNQSPHSGWAPGMPLPPPPPGPPPAARAVSVDDSSESSSARTPQPAPRQRTRPSPSTGSGLGSIPPTPADWVDEEYMNARPSKDKEPLHIDTSKAIRTPDKSMFSDSNETTHQPQRTPGSGGLFRSSAVRDPSAKGIRERRIERRNRQSQTAEDMSAVSNSGNPWGDALENIKPSNLVFPDSEVTPNHQTQPLSARFTPRSAQSLPTDGQRTRSRSRASSGGLFSSKSSYSVSKAGESPAGPSGPSMLAHTPPFSPNGELSSSYPKDVPQAVPPKALPTPPLNSAKESRPRSRATSRGSDERPLSYIAHVPKEGLNNVAQPLSSRQASSKQGGHNSLESMIKQDAQFTEDAIARHKKYIEEESAALNEADAMSIFTRYIITESQIRRERYAALWDSGSFDTSEVRSKLFERPPAQPVAPLSGKPGRPAPTLEIPSTRPNKAETAWWNNYQPCLSPIVSLNTSNDEQSSRGRAPSRWWESNPSSEGGERRVQRSKRESKYMGLQRDAIQWDQDRTPSKLDDTGLNYTGQHETYGPDEYPPEKVGWHDDSSDYPSAGTERRMDQFPGSPKMDISRLITLPPPYPRHYPAVNNSHPDLVSYRTTVRSITDLSEIKSTRERYNLDVERMSQDHQAQIQDARRHFKSNIQSQIQEGSLTFAEAAEAEAAMIYEENKGERDLVKRQLDTYQETVLKPMHAIIADRIDRATTCIQELSSRLFDDARHETPDQTQEEGDEKPELLEKLTQLKWLFEAREQLHREAFDLISDRDEKYKAVALLPYQQAKNEDKIRETKAFFTKDAFDRQVQHESESLGRLEDFLDVIEQNVVRGVEIQLSAFWDIAPSLLALVQQVPDDLHGFEVQIPSNEYEENPSYHSHPLQYLYSLLSHAEKSSYQYIESQTNLLCLLHEVRSAVMRAARKLTEAERIQQGEFEDFVRQDMQLRRAEEEASLTIDLKDKVSTVEGQWTEALGSQIEALRGRVKEQLIVEDGWEDIERLEEE